MSYQSVGNSTGTNAGYTNYENDVSGYGVITGCFAPIDSAFYQSPSMIDFQKKLNSSNGDIESIHSPISMQSEQKLSDNINELLNSYENTQSKNPYYNPDTSTTFNQNRQDFYNPNNLGTNLMEGYVPYACPQQNGLNMLSLILLILLIAALLYAMFWFYKNKKSSSYCTNPFSNAAQTANKNFSKYMKFG